MCKAIDFANGINDQITEAKEYYNKLKIKEKVFNEVQQDLLHKIENMDAFNLYQGWELTKSLQKLRQARRRTKNELDTMEILIKQLGGFKIQDNLINNRNTRLTQLHNEKIYHERQIQMRGDILEEVDYIVNNDINNKMLVKNEIKVCDNDIETYEVSEKLPKIKNSTINITFRTPKEKRRIINVLAVPYTSYQINDSEKYVTLINRKKGK